MTRISNNSPRTYRSDLRVQQAEETRGRILDAAGRVMADGIATLSIPAVAREAGVSVPTVYRHFATKADLLAAVYPHALRRSGLDELAFPRTLDEIRDGVRAYAGQLDSFDDLARAAMASPASAEVRALSMPRRISMTRRLVAAIDPTLDEADADRLARLLMVLLSSSSMRMWRDHLGLSVEQVADDVDWVVRTVVAGASRRKER
jgi:AcrR family transcriptional regulator